MIPAPMRSARSRARGRAMYAACGLASVWFAFLDGLDGGREPGLLGLLGITAISTWAIARFAVAIAEWSAAAAAERALPSARMVAARHDRGAAVSPRRGEIA